jgi:hypothetical protein
MTAVECLFMRSWFLLRFVLSPGPRSITVAPRNR